MSVRRDFPTIAAFILVAIISGCNSRQEAAPAIGHAFAGPAALNIRREIDTRSPTVATAHHGDALDIMGQRRRWYKVRTEKGIEGWVSDRDLLDTAQMERLKALAKETAGMPSQGIATTFNSLNVHSEPSRRAPAFSQIREHEKVAIIAHRVTERNAPAPKRELIPPRPKADNNKTAKQKTPKIPPPPAPEPPAPPADWVELSQQQSAQEPSAAETPEAPRGPVDDWTLIRTEGGQSGWVLTSGLYLAIPDEVAQYAEGHRITSYFSLGKIRDGDMDKDIWLWTTSDQLGEDHDFDGYRVFVWSLRRHRYETAYIQRRERGFFPVLAKTGEFSVCLERDDGSRVRKHYVMMGNAVRPAGEQPCDKHAAQPEKLPEPVKSEVVKKNFVVRIEERIRRLLGR